MIKTASRLALLTALTLSAGTVLTCAASAAGTTGAAGGAGPSGVTSRLAPTAVPVPDPSTGLREAIDDLVKTLTSKLVTSPTPGLPSKTFVVSNLDPEVTAKVDGWTNPSGDPLLWVQHPPVGDELSLGMSQTWDMHFRIIFGNESEVTYSLLDAKTGGVVGQAAVDMNTNGANVGTAACTLSDGVPDVACTISRGTDGTVQIALRKV